MSEEEHFELAIRALLANRSLRRIVTDLSDEQRRMLRFAQLLRGSHGQAIAPEFAEQLHARLFASPGRITRRGAVLSALAALAAGAIAALELERAVEHGQLLPAQPVIDTRVRGDTVEVFSV